MILIQITLQSKCIFRFLPELSFFSPPLTGNTSVLSNLARFALPTLELDDDQVDVWRDAVYMHSCFKAGCFAKPLGKINISEFKLTIIVRTRSDLLIEELIY